jgi:LysM repeat protein
VQSSDSCASIAAANNITVTQLQSYNPWIDAGCFNFDTTVGTQICLNEPGPKYIAPTSAIGSPTAAISAVPVPSNIAANTTTDCGLYYEVQPGDYCDLIIVKYGISIGDFLILNPGVNAK